MELLPVRWLVATGNAMAQLEKRPLDGEEEDCGGGVNAELDADERGDRGRRDILVRQELRDEMDDELLDEVSAVGNAGDEGGAGNLHSAEWQARTDRTDEKRGHAEGDERELPEAGGNGDGVIFTEI